MDNLLTDIAANLGLNVDALQCKSKLSGPRDRKLAAAVLHYFGYSAKIISKSLSYSHDYTYNLIDAGILDDRYPGLIRRLKEKYKPQGRRIYALKNGASREVEKKNDKRR